VYHVPVSERPRDPSIVPWTALGEEDLGAYPIFALSRTIRSNPDTGRDHLFYRLDAPDWVNVIALTTSGRLVLVEQYRHGTDEVTLEIPGGAVDPGESPLEAAQRELEEETGYRAASWHLLGSVEPNPAFLSNSCWTYLARGCTASGRQRPDPGERLAIHTVTVAHFTALIDAGHIRHSLVIAAHDHLRRAAARREAWVVDLGRQDVQG
jgi:8-oxo-dGTP pyrophosphatase MutT (NUDIX family)